MQVWHIFSMTNTCDCIVTLLNLVLVTADITVVKRSKTLEMHLTTKSSSGRTPTSLPSSFLGLKMTTSEVVLDLCNLCYLIDFLCPLTPQTLKKN